MYNILVCDDDKEIVEAIDIYLTQEGYHVLKAYDGLEALDILEREKVSLLILDVMMPRMDGIRATLKIREKNSIPIIILSAKSEDADKILGLNVGADDYVTKPFNPLELVARVKSQLRRYNQLGGSVKEDQDEVYEAGGLRINDSLKEVTVDGEPVKLTPIEYKIVAYLAQNSGKVITYATLLSNVWGPYADSDNKILRVNMANIRRKIEDDPAQPRYIFTEVGVGYRMAEDEEE